MSDVTNRPDASAAAAIGELLAEAKELEARLDAVGDDRASAAAGRLRGSVIRPLEHELARARDEPQALGTRLTDAPAYDLSDLGDRADAVFGLAREATRLRLLPEAPPALQEATAALQDLTCSLASQSDDDREARALAEFAEIQSSLPPSLQSATDGPYLATNVTNMVNWLGERLPTRPQMALCRCGQSAIKPLCDGTHATIGFSGDKDPKRVPDRRDEYVGVQVTVLDNRGTCQHAGFCTDRLATVFRLDAEPFVAPSGGRMDEIIRAVRDCPSGALSYAIDGQEARQQVDHGDTRPPVIEVSKDGPYRITGSIALLDADGNDQPRNEGASREHYALCRCGHSQNKPFCSGMHWHIDFEDPHLDGDHQPTIFEWAGGLPALTRMTRLFYEKHVPHDPLLAPLFADMSADHPERVACWLAEVFCGPKLYSRDYGGYSRMVSQHRGKALTEEQRARWAALLVQSAAEAGLPNDPEFRSVFSAYIDWGSRLAVENSQPGARPPEQMPMPHWDWNTAAGPPGSRISALAPETDAEDEPVVLPGPDESVSYERHIRQLFRQRDRQSMSFAFDLWSYNDVTKNAAAILERLHAGSMPCDGAWPADWVAVFARWTETGTPE